MPLRSGPLATTPLLQRSDWPFHVVASLIALAFILFKTGFLHMPLFWDEAWVYAPAVRAMYAEGPSLLPNAISPELTRGHPLLFHFLATLWTKVWGPSNLAMHAFALVVSVLTLGSTYLVGLRIASPIVGAAAMLMLALDEAFLAQSGILLPEVLLGLFVLLTVHQFIQRNTFGYFLFATCALLTKESALVAIMALLVWQCSLLFFKAHRLAQTGAWKWIGITLVPVAIAGLFFVVQYVQLGWVFYPDHLGMMSFDPKDVHYKFKMAFNLLFEYQGMEWTTYAFGLAAPLLWRGWKPWLGVIVVLLYVSATKVLVGRWAMPPLPTLIVTLSCFAVIFRLQFMRLYELAPKKGAFASIGLILVLGFLLFSALNFFADRYLVPLLPIIAIGICTVIHETAFRFSKWAFPAVLLLLCTLRFLAIGQDDRIGDTRLAYTDLIAVHKAMIGHLEQAGLRDAPVQASFTEAVYLSDPDAAYLTGAPFSKVNADDPSLDAYALFTSVNTEEELQAGKAAGFQLLERFSVGKAWGEIHHRPSAVRGPEP